MIVEDDIDSDDAIIDEFLPSMNQTTVVTALTSALAADDDFEPGHTSPRQLTPTLNQSRHHSNDGTVYLQPAVLLHRVSKNGTRTLCLIACLLYTSPSPRDS